jgi:hypothetical protein
MDIDITGDDYEKALRSYQQYTEEVRRSNRTELLHFMVKNT